MTTKEYRVLGHQVKYNVTESSEEFNKLDPGRKDAANDEAVANIVYRGMNPITRYDFLHGREAVEAKDGTPAISAIKGVEAETGIDRKTEEVKGKDGKVRMKDGVPMTRFIEAEEVFYNRVLEQLVQDKKFASEDAARAHFQPIIELIAKEVPFDVKAREAGERGPKKLPADCKLQAAKILTEGSTDNANSRFESIGKKFEPTGDTSVMFTGSFPGSDGKDVSFNVSEKDAVTLGWLLKEWKAWYATQGLNQF
jgi:hypothetical protein